MADPFAHTRTYVAQINFWRKHQGKEPITPGRMCQNAVNDIFLNLDGDMSPENLCCDGEISAEEARRKAMFFRAVAAEIRAAGFAPTVRIYDETL